MFDISIDTSSLSYTRFLIPGNEAGWIDGVDSPTVRLPSGEYSFQVGSSLLASFRFTVTQDGLVEYPGTCDAFLGGRGTDTLVVRGFAIKIDGTPLSHGLLPMLVEAGVLTPHHPHELRLVPGAGYKLQPAAGIVADFKFTLGVDGNVIVDSRYAGFAQADGRTLTINGYKVRIDGRQLSHGLLPANLFHYAPKLPPGETHEVTYIPAAGYLFQPAAGIVADFKFTLGVDGNVIVDSRYAGFAHADGRTLTINGYKITLNTGEISGSVLPSLLTYSGGPLSPGVHRLAVVPAAGYVLFRQGFPAFQLSLDIVGVTTLLNAPDGVTAMSSRRFCAVPDKIVTNLQIQTYGSPGGRWSRNALTYSIDPTNAVTDGLTPAEVGIPVSQAFNDWQLGGWLTFTPVASNGDIKVAFGGTELDPSFDSKDGTAASAGYPEDGTLCFDSHEVWTLNKLKSVALHEIGHVIGLSHSNDPASLMYPYDGGALVIDAESRDAYSNLYGWRPQTSLGDRGTTDRPTLAAAGRVTFTGSTISLRMVWKGIEDDPGLYESTLGPDSWTPPKRIEGPFGSTHSPSLTSFTLSDGASMGLLMAYRGVEGDEGLYFSTSDGISWTSPKRIPDVGSSTRPSVATYGAVYMAWKGIGDDPGIYWSQLTGAAWEPQVRVAGVGTTDSPTLVTFLNRLYMFWKGVEDDSHIYYTWQDDLNPIWRPQQAVTYAETATEGGVPVFVGTTHGPSAIIHGNRILLAWKGIESDPGIYYSYFDGSEFTGQVRVNGAGTSQGPGVYSFGGMAHMAWKGVEGDSSIWWTTR
ncbi:matrixin family metalloprotease [Streptomyces sp. NPDC058685]|uniref:matrixin family metalloprotease n=1 Tax=Streptomyces sp. NPDC058685 TaxID=3346598 RepID=UPI00364DE114